MATKRVQFHAKSGSKAEGEIALPDGAGKAPGVVLVMEYWGLNDHIRSIVERLARAGFVAFAPDIYHGKVTKSADEAGQLMKALDWKQALDEIAGAEAFVASHDRSNGNVGIMGFCMGGALALAAAETIPGFGAIVPFYGLRSADEFDASKVRAPVVMHVAKRDQWVTPANAHKVLAKMQSAGKAMELHEYDADHAFFNDTRPEVHDPAAAKLAWDRSVKFLHEQLG